MTRVLNLILNFIEQGLKFFFDLIRLIIGFLGAQFERIPWNNFGTLPYWKQAVIIAAVVYAVYYLYNNVRGVLNALQSVGSAFVGLLGAIVQLLRPLVLVFAALAVVLWVVNNFSVWWLP